MLWQIPFALTMFAALWWSGYLVGRHAIGDDAEASVRLLASGTAALWLASVLFYGLSFLGLFSTQWAFAGLLLVALAAQLRWGVGAWQRWSADLRAVRAQVTGGPTWTRVIMAGGALVVILHGIRMAVAPPLAWDSLTYHLPKAAMWVQSGAFALPHAPDAWSYYRFFPAGGDLVWAWALLPVSGDDLLFLAQGATFLAVPLAAYAAARSLGADRKMSRLSALAIAFTPAVANFMGSAYVDNLLLALLLAVLALLRHVWDRPTVGGAALLGAAVGLAVGVKTSAVPLGLLAVAWVGVRMRRRPLVLVSFLAAAAIGAPSYLYAWSETGSLTWPFALQVGDVTVFPGHPGLTNLWRQRGPEDAEVWGFLASAFTGDLANPARWNLGYGPLWPLSWPLAAAGAGAWSRRRASAGPAAWAIAASFVLVLLAFSPSSGALRTTWGVLFPRLLTFAYATALVLGAQARHRLTAPALALLAGSGILLSLPRDWSGAAADAAWAWVPWLALGASLAFVARWAPGHWRRALHVAGMLVMLAALVPVRSLHRYPIFAQAAEGGVYQASPLAGRFASAWPIWQALDEEDPHVVAVAAGWGQLGHNWYWYPIMGSRLQNEIVHVPVTRSQPQQSYKRLKKAQLDEAGWLRRLQAAGVDRLALLPPVPPEEAWARRAPGLRTIASGVRGRSVLFEVRQQRATPTPR